MCKLLIKIKNKKEEEVNYIWWELIKYAFKFREKESFISIIVVDNIQSFLKVKLKQKHTIQFKQLRKNI